MSKKNRGHASSLSALSTIAIDLPTETGAPETAEDMNLQSGQNTNAVEIDTSRETVDVDTIAKVDEMLDEYIASKVDEIVGSTSDVAEVPQSEDAIPPSEYDAHEDRGLQADVAAIEADGPVIASIEAAEEIALAPPVDAPPEPDPIPDEVPAIAAIGIPSADASGLIANLQAKIAALKESKSKRVASGSKPRPNVTYTLLDKPLNWSSTPPVAQLQQLLFSPAFLAQHVQADGSVKLSEPDLFAAIVAGAASGALRTKQEPIRIFQYYRSNLLNANCLRWT